VAIPDIDSNTKKFDEKLTIDAEVPTILADDRTMIPEAVPIRPDKPDPLPIKFTAVTTPGEFKP
jgi:hypothetical protein